MDTGTHFAFGLGLAGLSQIDPSVSADLWTSFAVMIGTIAGSQAPDADTLIRFRGNEHYVRHHRGISHSVPAWFLWTGIISSAIWLLFPKVSFGTLALWVFIAVIVHVASDLFNTYGTQAMRPFTPRWIAWNIIHIFDPFLFAAHAIAIGLWISGIIRPAVIFPALYGIVLPVYYVWRTVVHHRIERKLPDLDKEHRAGDRYTAIPTVNWNVWNVVRRREGGYTNGVMKNGELTWNDTYECQSSPEIEASRRHPAVDAFLSFSPFPCPQVEKRGNFTIVRWLDARFQHRKQFPFIAVVKYNNKMEPVFSYVGWISDTKLEQKLQCDSSDSLVTSGR